MSAQESEPEQKLRVSLPFEVEAPFGVLDYETDDAIYESPFFTARYSTDEEGVHTIFLHWFNTTLRVFRDDPTATHLDYRNEQGTLQGILVDSETIEQMEAYSWPRHELPLLAADPASMKWLAARAMQGFDDEWDSL